MPHRYMQKFSMVQELSSLVQHHLNAVAVLEEALPLADSPAIKTLLDCQIHTHSEAVALLYDQLATLDALPDMTVRVGHEFRETWQTLWSGGDDHALLVALAMNEYLSLSYLRQLRAEATLLPEAAEVYDRTIELEAAHFAELNEQAHQQHGNRTLPDDK